MSGFRAEHIAECASDRVPEFNIPPNYQSIARSKKPDYWIFARVPKLTGTMSKEGLPQYTPL